MKLNKENKGITLVALVITIIILLILAGITINSLIGSGLFENTKLAKEKYDNAEKLENETLEDYENKIGEYIDGSRQSGNVPIGPTLLWSYENDENGVLNVVGESRSFSSSGYNVKDFDAVIVDAGYPPEESYYPNLQSLYISKLDFNEIMNGIVGHASNWSNCQYVIKIDSINNKIDYIQGDWGRSVKKVIGIKY